MKTIALLATVAFATFAFVNPRAAAAPGDLDLTFGSGGKVLTDFGGDNDLGFSMAVHGNGKIVVAGVANLIIPYQEVIALARYLPDGTLDASFNGTGKVTTAIGNSSRAVAVVVQSDEKIVIAGSSQYDEGFTLVRYNSDGSLDTSFNGTGIVTTALGTQGGAAQGAVLQDDGKIVVTGIARQDNNTGDIALVRYNTDGSLDTSLNGTGIVTTAIGIGQAIGRSVVVQKDGRMVVVAGTYPSGGGSNPVVVRYNTNGSLDTSFNGTGMVFPFLVEGKSVALQRDARIVVGGYSGGGSSRVFAQVRFNANGSLDTSFNGTGSVTTAIGSGGAESNSVSVQSNGKIVGSGSSYNGSNYDFALVRYNDDGTLDTTFNGTGIVTTAIGSSGGIAVSMAVQSDGAIVVAGFSDNDNGGADFALVRYEGDEPDNDGDGIPDRYETGTGIYVSPTDTGTSPTNPDTDGDGLRDGEEVNAYHTNPNIKDTDGDGFDDGFEVSTGFNPTSAASTPDALSSIRTAAEYRFNAALGISYRIEASTDLANWTTIETNIIGAGGVITRFYSIEGQPKRFFRSRRN